MIATETCAHPVCHCMMVFWVPDLIVHWYIEVQGWIAQIISLVLLSTCPVVSRWLVGTPPPPCAGTTKGTEKDNITRSRCLHKGPQSNGYRAHIYLRVTGIWSLPQTSVHCLTYCTATHLKRGPNVALSSPQSAAIECFLARLGKSLHPPIGPVRQASQKNKSDSSTAGHLGPVSNACSVACVCVCSAFLVCCLAVTSITIYPTTRFHFRFYLSGARTVRWFISCADARRQGWPHCLHGRLPRTWPPT